MIPQWTAAQIRRRRHSLLLGVVPSTENSTLVASPWGFTDGDTTVTVTTKDANDDAMAGVVWTASAETITIDAAAFFVSTDKTDIDSNGTDVCTVTIQAVHLVNGEYVPLANIAANQFSIAVSGTNNTITQPASATNANGVTTGSFVTTQAAATKTVTVTALGTTLTQTPTVTTDGGYVPPAPGTPFFEEDFTGTTLNNANGFVWGSLTTGRTAVVSFDGYNAMRFRYGADASGSDSSAEMRFAIGQQLDEVWIEYYLHVPSNYQHRNDTSTDNNKFFRLWGYDYNRTNKVGATLYPVAGSGATDDSSLLYADYFNRPNTSLGSYGPTADFGDTAGMLNTWTRVRMHYRLTSADNAADGVFKVWLGTTKVIDNTTINATYDATYPYWDNGYFFGWSNSGFLAQTDFHVRNVKFYNTDPSW